MGEMSDSIPVELISYINIKVTRCMSGMPCLRKVAINDSSDDDDDGGMPCLRKVAINDDDGNDDDDGKSGGDMIMMMMVMKMIIVVVI
jgi:hypothetical protein